MQTRSKFEIFKPKLFIACIHSEPEKAIVVQTLSHWKKAMEKEYQALMKNNTLDLVPYIDALRGTMQIGISN